jgi:hypothetical protein
MPETPADESRELSGAAVEVMAQPLNRANGTAAAQSSAPRFTRDETQCDIGTLQGWWLDWSATRIWCPIEAVVDLQESYLKKAVFLIN